MKLTVSHVFEVSPIFQIDRATIGADPVLVANLLAGGRRADKRSGDQGMNPPRYEEPVVVKTDFGVVSVDVLAKNLRSDSMWAPVGADVDPVNSPNPPERRDLIMIGALDDGAPFFDSIAHIDSLTVGRAPGLLTQARELHHTEAVCHA